MGLQLKLLKEEKNEFRTSGISIYNSIEYNKNPFPEKSGNGHHFIIIQITTKL